MRGATFSDIPSYGRLARIEVPSKGHIQSKGVFYVENWTSIENETFLFSLVHKPFYHELYLTCG